MAVKTIKLLNHQYEVLADTTTKIIGLIGGYGNGKTYTACRKAIQLSTLNTGFTGIVTEPTYPLLRDIFIPEMKLALEDWGIEYKFNGSNSIFTLYINGKESKIICMSAENYERLVGVNAAWVIMDEFDTSKKDIAMNAFTKLLGRLRAGVVRQFVIFTTPEGFRAAHQIFVTDNKDGRRKLIKAKTTDNKYLPQDFIDTLRYQYPPNLLKAYMDGEFINLTSGTVYSYFNRHKHHTDREIEINDILHIGQDFNIGGCCGSVHVIDKGIPKLVDEYSVRDTQSIILHVKNKYAGHKIIFYPDASGDSGTTNASTTDIKLLSGAGFMVNAPASNPRIQNRVNSVNTLFYKDKYLVNTDKCPDSTLALEQQAYDDKGSPEKFSGPATIDDRTDCIGYFIHRRYPINGGMTYKAIQE